MLKNVIEEDEIRPGNLIEKSVDLKSKNGHRASMIITFQILNSKI